MKRFDLPNLIRFRHHLEDCATSLSSGDAQLLTVMTGEHLDRITEMLDELHVFAKNIGFQHAGAKAWTVATKIRKLPFEQNTHALAGTLLSLRDDLDICMFSHAFLQVEVNEYLDGKSKFGDEVLGAFPSALSDITDAGHAIAVGLNSAAVFHMMHIVEWGLRALAHDVGLINVVTDAKLNKRAPIEHSQWDRILNQLPDEINKKVGQIPVGDVRQESQEFYYSSLQDIRGFKDAWRNHIMHTRATYTREDAVAVWSHVQRFMQSLAKFGLKEQV